MRFQYKYQIITNIFTVFYMHPQYIKSTYFKKLLNIGCLNKDLFKHMVQIYLFQYRIYNNKKYVNT